MRAPRGGPPIEQPRVEVHPAAGELRGIAVFCHGGTATSVAPPATSRSRWCGWHYFTRMVVLGATGIEPMSPVITRAVRRPAPEGLAVPF